MKESPYFDTKFLEDLGILDWGYTEEPLPQSFSHYDSWSNQNFHGPLNYLADHRKHLRKDLRNIFPDFQSALVFLFSYQAPKKWMLENNRHELAAYSLGFEGEDYHRALKDRLNAIIQRLPQENLKTFTTLDTQPVLERDLAYRAGLGWFGKNSMLINQKEGSYFIIGSLLLNQKLSVALPVLDVDHCGHCTACADACPTEAINVVTRTLVAEKCISTFTIEIMKDSSAPQGFTDSRGEIFGCDICQDVCPWNKKPLQRITAHLKLKDRFSFLKSWFFETPLTKLEKVFFEETNRGLKRKLSGTPFDRPGRAGWLKNLKAILSNRNDS